jgi:hypothetical protein
MPAPLTPAERLSRFRQSLPAETRIAEALSLAVRIEPALLRDVRLILFPRSKASLEADLYFSPLVSQRTTDWITLDPQLSLELQGGLVGPLELAGAHRDRILQAREAIVQAHRQAPVEIVTEEEVIWLAVRRQEGVPAARAAIDARLRELLMRMLRASEESVALARWFAAAAHRMPVLARETEAFSVLAFATSSTLGGRKIERTPRPSLDTFETLARYLPESARRIPLWMGLTTRGLHILPAAAQGYERIETPLTNPVLLDVRGGETVRRLVQVAPGQPTFVPLADGNIVIRTLLRDSLNFRPRARRTEPATAASHIKQILLAYAHQDDSDLEFVRRLQIDLQSRGYEVLYEGLVVRESLRPGDAWIQQLNQEVEKVVERADCMIVVFREAALSETVRTEIRLASSRGIPILPILRSGDSGLIPYELRHMQFADFRETVPYDEALAKLLHALRGSPDDVRPVEGELVGVPPPHEHVIPRPEILRQLDGFASGKERVVSLVGRAGTGKTSLAIEYARLPATREAFPGGIVWLNSLALKEDELRKRAQQKQPHLFILPDVRSIEEVDRLSTVMGEQSRLLFTSRERNYADWIRVIHVDRPRIYVSYSHKDRIWFDQLAKFLKPLGHAMDVWEDTLIGNDEENTFDTILYPPVAVLLVSAHYLASDILRHKQLPLVGEAAERGELRVVWIAVGACPWESTPLAEIQPANDPNKPLDRLSRPEQDRELARIAKMISDAVGGPQPASA